MLYPVFSSSVENTPIALFAKPGLLRTNKPHFHFRILSSISIPNSHTPLRTVRGVSLGAEDGLWRDRVSLHGDSQEELPAGLLRELMPRHVAIIMDGNARWAQQRGLPAASGHEAGVRSLRLLIELCCRWGIKVLTVFAFSSDNWNRPKVEVAFLVGLFEREIKSRLEEFMREGIRVSMIGDVARLPVTLQEIIKNAEDLTKDNSKLQLIVAVSYSGRYDIVKACRSISHKVKDGFIQVEEISENLIEQELETSCSRFPHPDLLIRTSGEIRVSNFFLWQLAYAELFFVRSFWPDFSEADFLEALSSFQQRQRRYGRRKL